LPGVVNTPSPKTLTKVVHDPNVDLQGAARRTTRNLCGEKAMRDALWGKEGEPTSGIERAALWLVLAFNTTAVIGFAVFGVNPQLLEHVPWAVPFYARSFRLFSIGQILVAGGALALLLTLRSGWRWIPAFLAIYLISLSSELSGTAFGFPFGPYYYTPILGPQWFDLVPLVIPLSWFMMAVPSFLLAIRLDPEGGAVSRVALGALILTAWDLALDPAMSYATVYWRWEVAGAYYGMPWVNLAGWLFTGILLMAALVLLRAESWVHKLPLRWVSLFYLANVLLPLGMAAGAGLVWAVVLTVAGYAALGVGIWLRGRMPVREAVRAA